MSKTTYPPHITDYKIVSDADTTKLSAKVDHQIYEGWQPHGSMVIDRNADGVNFLQPMVKYAEWV